MRLKLAAALTVLALCAPFAHAAPAEGPKNLLITYKAEPGDRPAFRRHLAQETWARLEAWRKQGVISGFQILYAPTVGSYTWDAMLVLRFARFTDTAKWNAIERDAPGGLSPEGVKLGRPVDSYAADAEWEDGADTGAADKDAVFYVIPYEYQSADQYRQYMDGYVLPQVRGWMKEGVLTGYRMFMNRYPVGKPWDVLFVYRYKDLEAFGRRDDTVRKVRATLKDDPAWKQFHEIKSTIRSETENTVAEAVRPE